MRIIGVKISIHVTDFTLIVYVGPQIGMNPIPILGLPDLETNSGSPRSDMGIAFLVFFFSHAQDRPFLTKN